MRTPCIHCSSGGGRSGICERAETKRIQHQICWLLRTLNRAPLPADTELATVILLRAVMYLVHHVVRLNSDGMRQVQHKR
mmetsp:Transcript_42257/g.91719  ORF Transcript_42257/g.91719 Transcript_42257/m.91719 type:complete len:80 (-) Transcript_42257:14-253(-)